MKTILYTLIVILLAGMIFTGFNPDAHLQTRILVVASSNTINPAELSRSADIIARRLEDFTGSKPAVSLLVAQHEVQFTLRGRTDMKLLQKLVSRQGKLGFYETYDQDELAEVSKGKVKLLSIFPQSDPMGTNARLGCCSKDKIEAVEQQLPEEELEPVCRFVWGENSGSDERCLYALRLLGENGIILSGQDLEKVSAEQDKKSGLVLINLKFNQEAVSTWAEATRRNMDHAIAIVLDDKVIAAPVVRSVIEGGNSQISGDFSLQEARYMAALIRNGELPCDFRIIK